MIIFSVERPGADNAKAHTEVLVFAAKDTTHGWRELEGIYQGVAEGSYLTTNDDKAKELAAKYNQDSYLERGHYGYWYLIETTTGQVIKTFAGIREVDKPTAAGQDHTKMGSRYFVAV